MTIDLSEDAQKLVDEELATGAYASASEVVEIALRTLVEKRDDYKKTVQAVREGVADAEAGRVCSVEDAFQQIEERNPYLRER